MDSLEKIQAAAKSTISELKPGESEEKKAFYRFLSEVVKGGGSNSDARRVITAAHHLSGDGIPGPVVAHFIRKWRRQKSRGKRRK